MAAHHFRVDGLDHVGNAKAALVLGDDGVKDHLQEQIAQLLGKFARVAGFHGVECFVGFLDQVLAQRFMGLLTVPGAAAWAVQALLQRDQFGEPFAGELITRRDGNFRAVRGHHQNFRFASGFSGGF